MGIKTPIYLDYAASTPVDKEVLTAMLPYLTKLELSANPSGSHQHSLKVATSIAKAKQSIANKLGCYSNEIVFVSGATEANNLIIKAIAKYYLNQNIKAHFITSSIEHKSILEIFKYLEQKSCGVSYLKPNNLGEISISDLKAKIKSNTKLVSLMHANNETGNITNIKQIAKIVKGHNILLHSDMAQSLSKLKINLRELNLDFASFSGHKLYAPKGIGFCYLKQEQQQKIKPLILGGGQEFGLRSGTSPTFLIIAMAKALEIEIINQQKNNNLYEKLRFFLWNNLKGIKGIKLNTDLNNSILTHLNISFSNIKNSEYFHSLIAQIVSISTGSSCNSLFVKPSHVLTNMGLSEQEALASIRFSLGKFLTFTEIKYVADNIKCICNKLVN